MAGGINDAGAMSAYEDLKTLLGKISEQGIRSGKDYDVRLTGLTGSLKGRTVTLVPRSEKTEVPGSLRIGLDDFVRSRLEMLFPGENDLEGRVADFLDNHTPLQSRDTVLRERKAALDSRKPDLNASHAETLAQTLTQARVREVKTEALKNLMTRVGTFVANHPNAFQKSDVNKKTLDKAITNFEKSIGKLATKTGSALAEDWQKTLDGESRGRGIVETAADVCMEASTKFMQFIDTALQVQAQTDVDLTPEEQKLLDDLETTSTELATYSRDIITLADDMVSIAKSTDKTNVAQLKKTFGQFTEATSVDAESINQISAKLKNIGTKADSFLSAKEGEAQKGANDLLGELGGLGGLLKGLGGLEGLGEGRNLRQLRMRAGEVKDALVSWDRGNNKKDEVSEKARPHLRSPEVLQSVFDGVFDTDFYLDCRKKNITDEQMDFAFVVSRQKGKPKELGSGNNNTAYTVQFGKVGSFDREDGVFKDEQSASETYSESERVTNFHGFSNKDVNKGDKKGDKNKVKYTASNVNFASWKVADKWLGVGGSVVRSSPGYVVMDPKDPKKTKKFGFIMEKAGGVPLDTDNDVDKLNTKMRSLKPRQKWRTATELMLQGNNLDWCDWLTGQFDRHYGNVMIDIDVNDKGTESHVQMKGIDNDTAFGANRIGLNTFKLSKKQWQSFKNNALAEGYIIAETDFMKCGAVEKKEDGNETFYIINRLKLPKGFGDMLYKVAGLNSARRPSFITTEMFAKLEAIHDEIAKGQDPFTRDFGDYLPEEALVAMRQRFDEMYEYALQLKANEKVFSAAELRAAGRGDETKTNVDAAKDQFKKLLEVVHENKVNIEKSTSMSDEDALEDTYDFGYSLLRKLNFFEVQGEGLYDIKKGVRKEKA